MTAAVFCSAEETAAMPPLSMQQGASLNFSIRAEIKQKNTYNLWVEICFTTLNNKKGKDPKLSLDS